MTITIVEIRPVAESDIALLEKHLPQGGEAKHVERLSRQQKGEVVYFIAWHQGQPVGHALLKWGGSQDEHVVRQLRTACPDIEDLFVLEELRSQGIGSQLLHFAEQAVWERAYTRVGLSVGAESNDPARRLYERLGYHDAHFGEYTERGEYLDSQGCLRTWEEICIYLIKDLSTPSTQATGARTI